MRFLSKALKGREPMLIDPARAAEFADVKVGLVDQVQALFGSPDQPQVVNGYGIVPLKGVIGKSLLPVEKMMGAADLNDFTAAVEQMAADPAVHTILLDVSSPGGTVTGVEEAAAIVRAAGKPTIAFTDTEMASAAYWIGAAADRVVATPSATVGSIGVYMAFADTSKMYADAGVKVEVIKSGDLKAAGIDGTSLSDAQRADLQAQVDEIHAEFKASVRGKRAMVDDSAMRGQVFSGRGAAKQGLVTGLVNGLGDIINGVAGKPAPSGLSAAKIQALLKPRADDLAPEVLDLLTPRQKELVEAYQDCEETFGAFDQTSGPDGAHYAAPSPFAAQGMVCQNCVFYRGPRGCGIVSGDIDPNAICKLWVIPGSLIKG